LHGDEDLVCSIKGSNEFVSSKTGVVKFKVWEGGYHELHNEPFKKEVFDYILNWINNELS
jgi:alpha-beta hydrolase superfamily lysophospholipase